MVEFAGYIFASLYCLMLMLEKMNFCFVTVAVPFMKMKVLTARWLGTGGGGWGVGLTD